MFKTLRMTVLNKLAAALEIRSETPNIELGRTIAETDDKAAVKELVENLHNKSRDIQNDCMKALYEVGERKPDLIAEYYKTFLDLLDSKNPRMVWGTMCALSAIALEKPKELYNALPKMLAAVDKSQSVIARDHVVYLLAKLATIKRYTNDAFDLLLEIIMKAPVNQLPMYAEKAAQVVATQHKSILSDALICRLEDVEQDPKRKRIEKVLKKLGDKKNQ